MFHTTFTNSATRKTFEIQNNISKLLIRCEWDSTLPAQTFTVPSLLPYFIANEFCTAVNGNLSVTRHSSKLGAKQIIQSMPLADLAEIASNNEGFIYIQSVSRISGVTRFRAEFSIELSNEGSIHADKSDFLKIDLDSFAAFSNGAGTNTDVSYNFYSLGGYTVRNEHLKYSPVACQANAVTQFDCMSHYGLAVPKTLVVANITSATGEMLEFINEEMEIVSCDLNDVVYLVDGYSLPYNRWRVFPIALANKASVKLSASGNCYLLGNKNYEA